MEISRWENFTKRQQLMMIGAELMKAKVWQYKDEDKFTLTLCRALELIDLSIIDDKWKDSLLMILRLRDEVAKFYIKERTDDILIISRAF